MTPDDLDVGRRYVHPHIRGAVFLAIGTAITAETSDRVLGYTGKTLILIEDNAPDDDGHRIGTFFVPYAEMPACWKALHPEPNRPA